MGRIKVTKTEQRRLKVAELLAARPGLSVRRIARELGCSVTTAHRDVHAVRAEWAERRRDLVEQCAAEDLARTDAAIAALWPAVLAGKGWAVDRLVSLLTYRARVLGLEAQRHELDVGELLAGYLARLAQAEGEAEAEDGGRDGAPA